MKVASAFVPGHISGFFEVCDEDENPLKVGSRNCGPCIEVGVRTDVEVENSSSIDVDVSLGGKNTSVEATRRVVEESLKLVGETATVKVYHEVGAPIGFGYGMSGAGALGAALAISEALDLELDRKRMLAGAHKAEVLSRSGLGDVGPQMLGGLVLGLEPGGPPYGKWEKIQLEGDWGIVCSNLGPISTSGFLEDSESSGRARELGGEALIDLLSDRTMENFMTVSRKFSRDLGIFDDDFLEVLGSISSESPLGASAVMLGRAVFAPAPLEGVEELESVFLEYFDREKIMKTSVDFKGGRVLT